MLGLVAIPVYLEESTAIDSLRSFLDVRQRSCRSGASTAFGRGYADLELCFALFCAAGRDRDLDRPARREPAARSRSCSRSPGARRGGGACSCCRAPSATPRRPRRAALSLLLDWLHLISGSIWLGGLVGLLVLWRSLPAAQRVAGLVVTVPRFSNVAFVSVMLLLGTGIGASVLHLPVLSALWQTSYGQAILVKAGLLLAAMVLASFNLFTHQAGAFTCRRWQQRPRDWLRRLVTGEAILVAGAILVAASSPASPHRRRRSPRRTPRSHTSGRERSPRP